MRLFLFSFGMVASSQGKFEYLVGFLNCLLNYSLLLTVDLGSPIAF